MSESAQWYTIWQAARRVGVPARTIRFWCDSGVLPPAGRSAGGYRRYDAAAIARLDLVRTLRDLGLGLDDIRAVLGGGKSVAELASVHASALDAQIRVLRVRRAVLRVLAAPMKRSSGGRGRWSSRAVTSRRCRRASITASSPSNWSGRR